MPKPKRVNAYLAAMQQETDEPTPLATVVEESVSPEAQNIPEEQIQTPTQVKKELKVKIENNENKNYHLKQVNFTVGKKRELKLDELAFTYTKQKEKRVNRNDIVRYLIDTISIEALLRVDLSKHEK
jgi:hypothetical protein